ncbi:hypothetical protein [Methanimicrococcus hacksteinii]|nr:hypothetical protein [Methanimicrococcus sp. At1]
MTQSNFESLVIGIGSLSEEEQRMEFVSAVMTQSIFESLVIGIGSLSEDE